MQPADFTWVFVSSPLITPQVGAVPLPACPMRIAKRRNGPDIGFRMIALGHGSQARHPANKPHLIRFVWGKVMAEIRLSLDKQDEISVLPSLKGRFSLGFSNVNLK